MYFISIGPRFGEGLPLESPLIFVLDPGCCLTAAVFSRGLFVIGGLSVCLAALPMYG